MRTFGRALAVALLGGLAGAAWIVLLYAFDPGLHLDMSRPIDPVAKGFYPLERDEASGLTFAWTERQADIDLPALDRRAEWQLVVRLRGARPQAETPPELSLAVDGVIVSVLQTTNEFVDVHAPVRARADLQRGVRVTLTSSDTFRPGPEDPRDLGVMVDELRIRPVAHPEHPGRGIALAPRPAMGGGLVVGLVMGAAMGLVGITAGSAVGAVLVLTAGHAVAVVRHLGPNLPYAYHLGWLALVVAAALVVGLRAAERASGGPLRNTARFAAVFTAAAAYLELVVLLHPSALASVPAPQAWRVESVLEAQYLGWIAGRAAGEIAWYTAVVLIDALAGLLLYPVVVRSSGDRLAGAMAVALYHLIPIGLLMERTGHLTTALGHSIAVLVLVAITAGWLERRTPARLAALTGLVALAFLSQAGTFAVLLVALLGVAAAFRWLGGPVIRSAAGPLLLVTVAATAVGVLLYYGHLITMYGDQGLRLLAEPPHEIGHPSTAERLLAIPRELRAAYGVAPLLLACGGGAWMWRRRQADWLGLALVGWAGACLLLLLPGTLAPLDIDYHLAFLPIVALLGAIGASWLWRPRGWTRIGVGFLLAIAVWRGVGAWLGPLL
jgi:hypothetical protein